MPLTIVSHNAYWFQAAPSLWGQERPAAHPAVLARLGGIYAAIAPDLLFLQEVPDVAAAEHLAERLGMRFCFSRGGKLAEYGAAALSGADHAELESLTSAVGPAERTCLRAVVGGRDGRLLTVLAVHLPSNRFAPFEQTERQRIAELAAGLDLRGPPDLVVGDFNCRPDSAVHRYMIDRGYRDAAEVTGWAEALSTSTQRVDYVWVSTVLVRRLRSYRSIGSDQLTAELGGESRLLSDHFPQVAILD
jgi:endonuclease/exonuclease/phosphatase family metal-dependent hydrolase